MIVVAVVVGGWAHVGAVRATSVAVPVTVLLSRAFVAGAIAAPVVPTPKKTINAYE